jgi:nickel transport protein
MMTTCAMAVLLAGSALDAHDIAVLPTTSASGIAVAVKYGHPGDYGATVAGKLVALDAYAPSGQRTALAGRVRPEGLELLASLPPESSQSGTWVFAAFYDNGFFVKTAEGRSVNTTKADYPFAEAATHNLKFAKALLNSGSASRGFDRVVGHRLELVPRTDPFATGGGDLQLEVMFDGKPLAGATVHAYGEGSTDPTKYVADRAGIARLRPSRAGQQILSVSHELPSRHPDLATRDVYTATLVFSRS